jgi:hypothetical protein
VEKKILLTQIEESPFCTTMCAIKTQHLHKVVKKQQGPKQQPEELLNTRQTPLYSLPTSFADSQLQVDSPCLIPA